MGFQDSNLERQTCRASLFLCTNASEAVSTLSLLGVAVVQAPKLRALITASKLDEARTFAKENAVPIFHEPVLDPQGRCVVVRGLAQVSVGSGQHRQAPLEAGNEVLCGTRRAVEKVLDSVIRASGVPYKARNTAILVNMPGEKPVGPQAFHVDMAPGKDGFVVIVALEPNVSLLLAPGSHVWVKEWARLKGHGRTEEEAATVVPQQQLVRLSLEVGQVLLLHGNTVHAGDRGVAGEHSLRLHWYVQSGRVANTTYMLPMLSPHFAKRFV
ncbi:hypothetical protein PLESTB_000624800 [Pleodorina starrii]|uniref:Phytanoyl-CoA dioxygenase n=1 Tax=Pleodorina starrii TaxID=330485 RepID=A0A9W6BI30_9CHLO|nr:hypothetical protein PLESTB_000624800 [Pleodorina starrii]